ncbi:hypothetical protein CPC08DRAFT_821870 [Agrocybe pediades]|nr:hypothetical protein CPC08DRAFT_821870 [Agrocybe pediades]
MDALPPEIYWKIFMINTERGDKPLNLDDMDLTTGWIPHATVLKLEFTTEAWKEVMASRIDEASLWITGYVTDSTRPFIFAILQEKWQNVQELEIWDEYFYHYKILRTWSFLQRDAPKLEVFHLWTNTEDDYTPNPEHVLPFSPLFGNTAPRLKIFKILDPFQFSLPTPWMANLNSITFVRPQNGPLILSALKFMPSLRELYVSGNTLQPMFSAWGGNLDKPHLPMLESLVIDDFYNPMDMIILLESITLAPGQRSVRKLFIPKVDKRFPDHQRVHRAVTKWIHAYTSASTLRHLILTDSDKILSLDSGQELQVDIVHDDNQSHVTIQEIVASLRHSVIQELGIFLMDSPSTWPLQPLFQALRSVTHLTTDGDYTELLFHDILQFSLFPDLHTIHLLGPWDLPNGTSDRGVISIMPTVIHFLEQRVLTGSALSVLDLSAFDPQAVAVSNKNEKCPDKIPGLSVILPIGSDF